MLDSQVCANTHIWNTYSRALCLISGRVHVTNMRASCDSEDQCQQQRDAYKNRFFIYRRGEVLFNMFPIDETIPVLGGGDYQSSL